MEREAAGGVCSRANEANGLAAHAGSKQENDRGMRSRARRRDEAAHNAKRCTRAACARPNAKRKAAEQTTTPRQRRCGSALTRCENNMRCEDRAVSFCITPSRAVGRRLFSRVGRRG